MSGLIYFRWSCFVVVLPPPLPNIIHPTKVRKKEVSPNDVVVYIRFSQKYWKNIQSCLSFFLGTRKCVKWYSDLVILYFFWWKAQLHSRPSRCPQLAVFWWKLEFRFTLIKSMANTCVRIIKKTIHFYNKQLRTRSGQHNHQARGLSPCRWLGRWKVNEICS